MKLAVTTDQIKESITRLESKTGYPEEDDRNRVLEVLRNRLAAMNNQRAKNEENGVQKFWSLKELFKRR